MSLMSRIQELIAALTARLAFLPPALARLCLGVAFIVTGWGKLHNLEQVTQFFTQLGIPFASLQAPFIAGLEFFGGILLLVGLLTRVAAALLACTMIVALLTAIVPKAEGIGDIASAIEVAYLSLFIWLAVAGPGALSLDNLIAKVLRRSPEVRATA
jgi:putative oxidoreductase